MPGGEHYLEFVWLPSFEASAAALFGEEERRVLELELVEDPRRGVVIPGTGGVRKLRVRLPSRGKRGGARLIYYFRAARDTVYMIAAYAKSDQADLTSHDKRVIRRLVARLEQES